MRVEREFGNDGFRERPLGDLLRELAGEGRGLLHEEVRLAKAELRHEARKATKGGAALGASGAVAWAALLLLGMTLVLVGATFMPAWLSALIVTVVYGAAALALMQYGKKELAKTDPSRALDKIKEDGRWAKETMRDVRSTASANA